MFRGLDALPPENPTHYRIVTSSSVSLECQTCGQRISLGAYSRACHERGRRHTTAVEKRRQAAERRTR